MFHLTSNVTLGGREGPRETSLASDGYHLDITLA